MKAVRNLFVCLVILSLFACSNVKPTATTAASPSTSEASGNKQVSTAYPLGDVPQQATPNYPAGEQPTEQVYPTAVTPTQDLTLGTVTGKILLNGKPVEKANLYLATVVKNAAGQEVATQLMRSTAPMAVSNNDGSFEFGNVPSGRYGLMMEVIPEVYLLFKPGTPQPIVMTVDPGKSVDLGDLNFDELPK